MWILNNNAAYQVQAVFNWSRNVAYSWEVMTDVTVF